MDLEHAKRVIQGLVTGIDEHTIWYNGPGLVGNEGLRHDFTCFSLVAYGCIKIGIDPEDWLLKTKNKRNNRKAEALEAEDYTTAIDIDQEYARFLTRIGNTKGAVSVAESITNGYHVPGTEEWELSDDPQLALLKNMQSRQHNYRIQIARSQTIRNIANCLARQGLIGESRQVLDVIHPDGYNYHYFNHLISYYEEQKDLLSLLSVIDELKTNFSNQEEADGNINNALTALGKLSLELGKIDDAISWTLQIEGSGPRFVHIGDLMSDLVSLCRWTEVEKLLTIVLQEIKLDDTYEKAFRRLKLAKLIAGHDSINNLYEGCLAGEDSDGHEAIDQLIFCVPQLYQTSLWCMLLDAVAKTGDYQKFDEFYQQGVAKYPEAENSFASIRNEMNSTSENRVLAIENPEDRARAYSDFVMAHYLNGAPLSDWNSMINRLSLLENEVLNLEDDSWDLDTLINDNPTDSTKIISVTAGSMIFGEFETGGSGPTSCLLIPDLARLALRRDEVEIFSEIAADPRMPKYHFAHLIDEFTDYALLGVKPELWAFATK